MHAEHADNHELNELSGRVIGCAFTVLNTLLNRLGHGSWKTRTRWHMKFLPQDYCLRRNTPLGCATMTSWLASTSWIRWSMTCFWSN